MLLIPEDKLQRNGFPCRNVHFLLKTAFSYRKMRFPAENCLVLQNRKALSCGRMQFSEETWQELQETARGLQGSRIENDGQLARNSQRFTGLSPSALSCQRIQEVKTFRRKWSGVREAEMLGKRKRPTCAFSVLKSMFGTHRRSCVVLRAFPERYAFSSKRSIDILL